MIYHSYSYSLAAACVSNQKCMLPQIPHSLLTLGAHAQRGLLYLVVLCVHDYSRTAGNEGASERYQQLQRNKRSNIKKAILLKRRRSRSRNWHYSGPRCVTSPSISGMTRVYRYARFFFRSMRIEPRGDFFCELYSTNIFVSSLSSVHCELFPMETSSASTLRKVCPQCSTTVHVRRAVCGCGYALYNMLIALISSHVTIMWSHII